MAKTDTYRSMPFDEAVAITESLGFEQVYTQSLVPANKDNGTTPVIYSLYWRDGLLLDIESFTWGGSRTTVNSSRVWGNWQPNPGVSPFSTSGSGHCTRRLPGKDDHTDPILADADPWVFVGYWNFVNGGIVSFLERSNDNGRFLPKWIEHDHLYLHSYAEDSSSGSPSPGYFEESAALKIAALPEHVRKSMGIVS